jgi:hypothetical protein
MSKELSFPLRAPAMGLRDLGNDCFIYDDPIGSVMYKHLQTKVGEDIPLYAVFTRPPVETENFTYTGFVSDLYQFEGNEVMNQKIRDSISEVKIPIFREYVYLNTHRTRMSNEILIQNKTSIPKVGDVFPEIVVKNTYDGSGAREFLFGFSILEEKYRIGFGFKSKIAKVRQVHNIHSKTSFSSPISKYVEFFSQNILQIIDANFKTEITEDHLLSVFDMLEQIGKKRRDVVSTYVTEVSKETGGKVNAWTLFLAITYFSTIERNVNIKTLLEDIAEKVLVIPIEIANVIKTLNS